MQETPLYVLRWLDREEDYNYLVWSNVHMETVRSSSKSNTLYYLHTKLISICITYSVM